MSDGVRKERVHNFTAGATALITFGITGGSGTRPEELCYKQALVGLTLPPCERYL